MADRYWVGGTAAWDGTAGTKWALTSGGTGGQAVPTSADDVFFDAASTGTCTISTGNTGAKSINCTGFTGTIAGTVPITVSGSVTLVAGMTYTYTGTLTINATATLTSGGKTLGSTIFNVPSGTVTLADAMTLGTSNTFTLTSGTLDLAGFTLSTGIFLSNTSSSRGITFGSGTISITTTVVGGTSIIMANMLNFSSTTSGGGFYRNQVSATIFDIGSINPPSNANAFNLSVHGSETLTFTSTSKVKSLNFRQDFLNATCNVIGSCEFAQSCSLSPSANYTSFSLVATGTGAMITSSKTVGNFQVTDELMAGTNVVDILGTLNVSGLLTLNRGTLRTNGYAINAANFQSSTTFNRTFTMAGSTITLSGSGSVWNCATSLNLTITGIGSIVMTSASAKTFAGGGKTYPTLRNAGAGALTISGDNTFTTIENTVQPTTFTFTSGTTQTVTNFNVNGSAGSPITINSTTPGSQATLSKASGQVEVQYVNLQDNNATGGATWLLKSGLKGSNVSGWYVNQSFMHWFF